MQLIWCPRSLACSHSVLIVISHLLATDNAPIVAKVTYVKIVLIFMHILAVNQTSIEDRPVKSA